MLSYKGKLEVLDRAAVVIGLHDFRFTLRVASFSLSHL